MGMIATCDRCGKPMNETVFNRTGACLSLKYPLNFKVYMLCKGCRKAFERWMEKVEYDHTANLREYAQDMGVTIEQAEEELRSDHRTG